MPETYLDGIGIHPRPGEAWRMIGGRGGVAYFPAAAAAAENQGRGNGKKSTRRQGPSLASLPFHIEPWNTYSPVESGPNRRTTRGQRKREDFFDVRGFFFTYEIFTGFLGLTTITSSSRIISRDMFILSCLIL
jgi:hypothetical protein